MLTLAGDRFYEEEFNLGPFPIYGEFDGDFVIKKLPENLFKPEHNLLVNIMME